MKLNEMKEKTVADLGIKYEGGKFDCSSKKLTSLKGAPQEVGGTFECYDNNLTSLEGAPQKVGGDFNCYRNNLTSLDGAPQTVGGGFTCSINKLTSLKGAPQEVGGSFSCYDNKLISLEGAPQEIGGGFYCGHNNLISLKDIHKHIKSIKQKFNAVRCPIKSNVLGLLLIKDLEKVELDNKEVAAIINSHLNGGSMRSALECQAELIQAGFEEYAKL